MAEDLGTWPPEQATVLLEVLGEAGLTPDAKRTREGVLVTVPEEQSDEAHRQLVSNMDRIARAARQPRGQAPRPGTRRPRPVKGADPTPSPGSGSGSPAERAMRPLGLILLGMILLLVVGRVNPVAAFIGLGVLVYLIGKRIQQQGGGSSGGSGPGLR